MHIVPIFMGVVNFMNPPGHYNLGPDLNSSSVVQTAESSGLSCQNTSHLVNER